MIITIGIEKGFEKFQHPFTKKFSAESVEKEHTSTLQRPCMTNQGREEYTIGKDNLCNEWWRKTGLLYGKRVPGLLSHTVCKDTLKMDQILRGVISETITIPRKKHRQKAL